jgi:cytidylate kinase
MKILIMGASGSGQTTLGKELSKQLSFKFIDGDDMYWLPTKPAYQDKRAIDLRFSMTLKEMKNPNVVLAGSIMGWGDELENAFDLIIFLSLDTEIRIERLKQREMVELGFVDPEFLAWARQYENPDFSSRSRFKHEMWMVKRPAQILKIEGDLTVQQRIEKVINFLPEQKEKACQ